MWNRVFSLSLFVEHMFEEGEKQLTPLLVEHTRHLGQVSLERWNLCSQRYDNYNCNYNPLHYYKITVFVKCFPFILL